MKRLSLSAVAFFGFSACTSFTPHREVPTRGSVGEEVYGVMCDRIVAQNLPEDLGAVKYGTVCHKDYYGHFAKPEKVESTAYADKDKEANRLARARVAALGKRRDDLIAAFDVVLADHDMTFLGSLKGLLTRMAPLYDADIPNLTNSAAAALNAIDASQDAVNGFTRVLNHNNYSNVTAGGGLLGVAVQQPALPLVLDDTYRLFGRGTSGELTLNQLLFALESSAKTQDPLARDTAVSSRSLLSVIGNVAVSESPLLDAPGTDNLTVRRDGCGNAALVIIAAPYADSNNDGCADTDAYGRYVDAHGAVIASPTPFVFSSGLFNLNPFNQPLTAPFNQGGLPLFLYTNARHTVVANMVAGAQPLLIPGQSTITSALTQLAPALGDLTSTKLANGLGSVSVTNYSASTSPAFDMALAMAPILRGAATKDYEPLTTLATVLRNNPQDGARLIGALLAAKNLANQDTQAKYVTTSTMWDEVNDALVAIADAKDGNGQSLGLIEKMLDGFATQTATANAALLADASAALLANRDLVDYDTTNLNAPAKNLTDAGGNTTPHTPVDRNSPTIGDNRSAFQRVVGMIAEGAGVTACNKQNAVIAGLPGDNLQGKWDECEIFKVPDIAAFLIDTIATGGDPTSPVAVAGKGAFPLTAGSAVDAIKILATSTGNDAALIENGFNKLMDDASGFTTYPLHYFPSPQAMSRMVFYRGQTAVSAQSYDTFLSGIGEPAATNLCPLNPDVHFGDKNFGVRNCSGTTLHDTMAERWQGTIFAFEANDNAMYKGLRPIVAPFVLAGREDLLINLFKALHRHWNAPQDTTRTTDAASYAYGSGANLATYEPLLAKMFASSTDLFGSMQALSKDLVAAGGAAKIAPLLYSFLSQAQNTSLSDRRGHLTSNRNDGTQNGYTTPALLLVQALGEIDTRRTPDPVGLAVWRTARSQLSDSLFATTTVNGVIALKNQGLQAALPLLLDAAVVELRKQANYETFVTQTYPNSMRSAIESPALEALTELVAVVHKDGSAEQNLLTLLSGTLDPSHATNFAEVSLSLVNTVSAVNDALALQPVTQAAAGALDPQTGALKQVLALLQDTRAIDSDNDMNTLMVRLATPMNGQAATPLSIISDTIVEVQRADPTQVNAAYDQNDTHHLLRETVQFLTDKQHGLQQLITIIQKRTSLQ